MLQIRPLRGARRRTARQAAIVAVALLLAMAVLVTVAIARPRALGPIDLDRFNEALQFMRENGRGQDADKLDAMWREGRILKDEFGDPAIGAETDRTITISSSRLGYLDRERGASRWFASTAGLAETLIHELQHARQWEASTVWIVTDAKEVEAWSVAMQAIYDWITARERQLVAAGAAERQRLADELKTLTNDMQTHLDGVKAYGRPTIHAADGRPLDADEIGRYVAQVRDQIAQIGRGEEPASDPDMPTARDLEEMSRSRLMYWRQQVVALARRESAVNDRLLDGPASFRAAYETARRGEHPLERYRQAQVIVLDACRYLAPLQQETLRLSRAAQGAQLTLGQQLDAVRRFRCDMPGHLNDFNIALQRATQFAVDTRRLKEAAVEPASQALRLLDQLAADGKHLEKLAAAFERHRYMAFQRDEFEPPVHNARVALADMRAALAEADALTAERRKLHDAVRAEATRAGGAGLQPLQSELSLPHGWPLQRDAFDAMQRDLDRLEGTMRRMLAEALNAQPPAACGDRATILRALDDALAAERMSILQLGAVEQLRNECASYLAGAPMPLPMPQPLPMPMPVPQPQPQPQAGAIAAQLLSIKCRGPYGDPGGGPRKRMVCDVRWSLTNTGQTELTWTGGQNVWSSSGETGGGGVGYLRPSIGPGRSEQYGMQCIAFGPPFRGSWRADGGAKDARSGQVSQWSLSGACGG